MVARPILIVDDDADTCSVVADVLADFGYRTGEAHDANEALELAGRSDYGLALLDYRLPCMTGVELFEQLRGYGLEAVLITGHANPDVAAEAAAAGMKAMLVKPLDMNRLLPLVEQVAGPPN